MLVALVEEAAVLTAPQLDALLASILPKEQVVSRALAPTCFGCRCCCCVGITTLELHLSAFCWAPLKCCRVR